MPKRNLLPRTPVVVAPLLVSQINCTAIAGIDPRRFLEVVRERSLPHGRRGKLVFVAADALREALTSDNIGDVASDNNDATLDDPESIDDVLALIGRKAT